MVHQHLIKQEDEDLAHTFVSIVASKGITVPENVLIKIVSQSRKELILYLGIK
jgi:hypothetical protein